jgi:hypothetical protein
VDTFDVTPIKKYVQENQLKRQTCSWVSEVVDIDSTSWRSKMTVNMHLFHGNKIVQMKK